MGRPNSSRSIAHCSTTSGPARPAGVRHFLYDRGSARQRGESGKRSRRTQLLVAIDRANRAGATLVTAGRDQLSRNAPFLITLWDSGGHFPYVDIPDANPLTIGIVARLAQHARELIGGRSLLMVSALHIPGKNPAPLADRPNADGFRTARRCSGHPGQAASWAS